MKAKSVSAHRRGGFVLAVVIVASVAGCTSDGEMAALALAPSREQVRLEEAQTAAVVALHAKVEVLERRLAAVECAW